MAKKKEADTMADKLRAFIEADGRSLYAIAKAAGIDYGALHHFTTGKKGLSLETADRLMTALRLDITKRPDDEAG